MQVQGGGRGRRRRGVQPVEPQLSRRCSRSDVPPVCDAWWIRDFGRPEALQVVVTRTGLDSSDAGGELVWSFVNADWRPVAQVAVVS